MATITSKIILFFISSLALIFSQNTQSRPLIFNNGCDGPCSGFSLGVETPDTPITLDPIDIIGVYDGPKGEKLFRCEDGGCSKTSVDSDKSKPYVHPDIQKYNEGIKRRKAAAARAQKALEEFNQTGLNYLRDEARKQEKFEQHINAILKSNQDQITKDNQLSNLIIDEIGNQVFGKLIELITPPVISTIINAYRDMKSMRGVDLEPYDMVSNPEDMKRLQIMLQKDNAIIQKQLKEQEHLHKENEIKLGLPIDNPEPVINRNPASVDPKEVSVRNAFIALTKVWSEDAGSVLEQLYIRAELNQNFPMSEKNKKGLQAKLLASFKSNTCEVNGNDSSCYLNSGYAGNICYCPIETSDGIRWTKGKSTRKPLAEYCETEYNTLRLVATAPLGTSCFNYIPDPLIGIITSNGKVVKSPCIDSPVPLFPGQECDRE